MTTYTLEIEAIGFYATDIPTLEIWADGVLDSSYAISSNGTSISLNVSYSGLFPSSLEFRFNDGLSETGRTIELQSVSINDQHVNIGNYLSADSLSNGGSATVNIASSTFMYDLSEPDPSEFAPVTVAMTNDPDTYVRFSSTESFVLDGLAGNDILTTGSGDDKVTGNDGDDLIRTNGGTDLVYGADGDDKIYGGAGDDVIYGGDGVDRLYGDEGNDEIYGNIGDDRLFGNEGDDLIVGGVGNDRVDGAEGADYLFGNDGNDYMIGDIGDDTIDGGAGMDTIFGGEGNDIINGGSGNDTIRADGGDDLIFGDEGIDIIFAGSGNDEIHGGADINELRGEDGNDVLYAGDDENYLFGGNGNDTIYSASTVTINDVIADILSNNAGVVYSAETNSFYQYISTGTDWSSASTIASGMTLTGLSGVNGHLATVTSGAENAFVDTVAGGNTAWIGASDAAAEGVWIWDEGPEAGQQFSNGLGGSINGMYENWGFLQPTDLFGTNDYAQMQTNGTWSANDGTGSSGYVVEWDADSLISGFSEYTRINGGNDSDDIYGSDGIDGITIDDLSGADTIYNFDASGRDWLDISDIISGYDPLSDDLRDFIDFNVTGGDTVIAVDSDGAANGSNFTDVAILDGVTDLDLYQMVHADNLII